MCVEHALFLLQSNLCGRVDDEEGSGGASNRRGVEEGPLEPVAQGTMLVSNQNLLRIHALNLY
jgi:hypothetical protein